MAGSPTTGSQLRDRLTTVLLNHHHITTKPTMLKLWTFFSDSTADVTRTGSALYT